MTEAFDPKQPFAGIELPVQDLAKLRFCNGSKASHVQKWAGQLQPTRFAQTSAQLYQSLPEISRLKTESKSRLDMLECLRPHVQNTIAGLSQEFLGQPLILPAPAQKAAIIAQALQKGMIDGYSLCVRDWCSQRNLTKQQNSDLALALYRALFSIGRLYLRSCQIYTQLPRGLWLRLHRLYRTAEHYQLTNETVDDPLLTTARNSRIKEAYCRVVMLACSRPNQLGQTELESAFNAFESWAANLDLQEDVDPDNDNPFVINLSRDLAPNYKILFDGSEADYLLEPDFSTLVRALEAPTSATALQVQTRVNLPTQLTKHLTAVWRAPADRRHQRQKVKTAVDVCAALAGCHFHLAGQRHFADFLEQQSGTGETDVPLPDFMAKGFTPAERRADTGEANAYSPVRVTVQNISAGGYCLQWQDTVPANVTAGQLLGIREAGQQDWLLGVVRWVRQLRGASQMGVQVLALDATPTAAHVLYDLGGQSDAMRALQIPADCLNRQPPTLITPAVPFQESQRVRLQRDGRVLTAQLQQCLFSTAHVRQFSYQVLGSEEPQSTGYAAADAEFDSDWN